MGADGVEPPESVRTTDLQSVPLPLRYKLPQDVLMLVPRNVKEHIKQRESDLFGPDSLFTFFFRLSGHSHWSFFSITWLINEPCIGINDQGYKSCRGH